MKTARALPIALLAALVALGAAPRRARAAEPDTVSMARAAYDRGARAYNEKKYALAAHEFTVADDLAPNRTALIFALEAALRLDDPILGMRLVERAALRGDDLDGLARKARDKFGRRAGRIALSCHDTNPCRAQVDGEPVQTSTWVTPGTHAVEWESGARRSVRVDAGESVEVTAQGPTAAPTPVVPPGPTPPPTPAPTPPPPPVPPEAPSSDGGGISPVWFWVGIGVTTIAAGATIASGVDTLHKHDVFAAGPTSAKQQDGQSAQSRTNVILGVSAGLAVATAAVGIFAVRWSSAKKTSTYLDVHLLGPGIAAEVRY